MRGVLGGASKGGKGNHWSSVDTERSLGTRLKAKNTRGVCKVCCTVHEGGKGGSGRAPAAGPGG
eukprot:8165236-Pyramimonas_sp.AAC.2